MALVLVLRSKIPTWVPGYPHARVLYPGTRVPGCAYTRTREPGYLGTCIRVHGYSWYPGYPGYAHTRVPWKLCNTLAPGTRLPAGIRAVFLPGYPQEYLLYLDMAKLGTYESDCLRRPCYRATTSSSTTSMLLSLSCASRNSKMAISIPVLVRGSGARAIVITVVAVPISQTSNTNTIINTS